MRVIVLSALLLTPVFAVKPAAQKLLSEAQALATEARQTYKAQFPDKPLWREAIAKAQQAAKLDPEAPEVWKVLAEIYTDTGWWSRAEESWKKFLALSQGGDPQPLARALRALGYLSYQRGDVKAAIDYFEKALVLEPESEEALAWLGRIYMEQGDGEKASHYWRLAAQVNPSDRNKYFAQQALKMSRYGSAAVHAFYLGYASWEKKDYANAIADFETAVRLAPDWVEAQRWLARVYMEAGMPAKAIPHWQRVIELEGKKPQTMHFLKLAKEAAGVGVSAAGAFFKGIAAYQSGDTAKAQAWFEKATEADPSYAKAWRWLGRVYYEQGEYRKAADAYQKAVDLNPDDAGSRYFLRLARKAAGEE